MSWKKLNYTEPAVLRGVLVAVFALLASLGVTIPADLPGRVDALVIGATTVLPLVQAVWTRLAVWSPKAKDRAVAAAARPVGTAQRPGIADHQA